MYYFYFSSVLGCCGCKNMATQNSGKSILIVPYEWKLENVEKDFKTIVSNMILFRGEKVFRAALKKSDKEQWTLVFLAINLNKIGLQASDVACGKEGADTNCKMKEYIPVKNTVKGNSRKHLRLSFKFTSKESSLDILTTCAIASEKSNCGLP